MKQASYQPILTDNTCKKWPCGKAGDRFLYSGLFQPQNAVLIFHSLLSFHDGCRANRLVPPLKFGDLECVGVEGAGVW